MKRIHKYQPVHKIASQIFKGATLIRSLFNEGIRDYELSGDVLDLGSKSMESSYYKYIRVNDGCNITFTDLYESKGVAKVNVEERFPFEDETFDMVIAFHLFEHVFDYQYSASEIYRVLKPGGKFIVSVPFMHKYHADPDDYFRFTDSAVVRIWEDGGLRCESINYIGEGIYSYFLTTMTRFRQAKYVLRPVQYFSYLIGTVIDRSINRVQRKRKTDNKTIAQLYALEHIAVFVK